VAIPWVTLVVTPLAMAGVVFAPLWDAAAWAIQGLTWWLQTLALWPWASVSMPSPPLWAAAAGVLGGVLMALRWPLAWRLLGLPLLLPVLWWQPQGVPAGQFELLAADVGQGNAVLVRTATHALLYDTGPRYSTDSDAGQRVLVPLLRALGVRVDVLMLSHRDADHIGGAPAVLAMQADAQLVSSMEDHHPLQSQRRASRCVAGQHWVWDGVAFDVLHPAATDYGEAGKAPKSNAMSCVLRVSTGAQTALLVGDIESPQEARLVAQLAEPGGGLLKADVLLVPHHGSKTSSSAVFLDAVQPRIALAQAGYRNRFNHPVPVVMDRYTERHIRVAVSPICGAAAWQSAKPEEVSCQRQNASRYWHHAGTRPE
jgi:competence protein ComEC